MAFPEWILANGETLQFALFFALLAGLAVLERLAPRRVEPMQRKVRWPVNLLLTFLNLVTLSVLPVSLIGAALWAESRGWGLLNRVTLPLAALIAINLLVRGFVSFSTHYLMHNVPLFWRIHRVHHLDTELDVTTTVRFHPLEFFLGALLGVPIIVAFGLTPWVLVLYETLDVVVTLWSHSNLRLPLLADRLLRYVIVTPDLHRVHHSAWQPETDSNFGAVFPVWDLVFGTFNAAPRGGHERMRLGLDEVRGGDAHRPLWLLGSVLRSRLDLPMTAPARRQEHEAVAGLDARAVDRTERLDGAAAGADHALLARQARLATVEPVRRLGAVLAQDRQLERREEGDLADGPVAAAETSRPSRVGAYGETLHAHRVAVLQDLRIGDAGVGHVAVDGARAVEPRSGAAAAAHRLVVSEALVAERDVVHRALTTGDQAQRPEERVDQALAGLDVAAADRRR
jgi:sterol desaturase/sphingolipid hydroxylase (fatty acid hydroxylase superfamily)